MGYLRQQDKERMQAEGRSPQEIAYFDAEKERDYEPILLDLETPSKVIQDIADRITIQSLKFMALEHPNIPIRSIFYILDKADKKPYYKDFLQIALNKQTEKLIADEASWQKLKDFHNPAGRMQLTVKALIRENKLTKETLSYLIQDLSFFNGKDRALAIEILLNPTNDNEIIDNLLDRIYFLAQVPSIIFRDINEHISEITKNGNVSPEMIVKLFEAGQTEWMNATVRETFMF